MLSSRFNDAMLVRRGGEGVYRGGQTAANLTVHEAVWWFSVAVTRWS